MPTQFCLLGVGGAVGALVIIGICHIILYYKTTKGAALTGRAARSGAAWFFDIIVTSEDESYSLSRLQIYLWTVVVITAFSAISFATFMSPGTFIWTEIPTNLYILMGLNVTTAVASTAVYAIKSNGTMADATNATITAANAANAAASAANAANVANSANQKNAADAANASAVVAATVAANATATAQKAMAAVGAAAANTSPAFFRDIFFDTRYSLDLPRTQMFVWTVIILAMFILMVGRIFATAHQVSDLTLMGHDIPIGLVALMGVSNGAYIGAKAATPQQS